MRELSSHYMRMFNVAVVFLSPSISLSKPDIIPISIHTHRLMQNVVLNI
jgi:hypothetical protein